jgi:diguanylate cyclase (GGDEF)-like protein
MKKHGTILIIDDTASIVGILTLCLNEQYEILSASNGEQGIKLAQQTENLDLILLDIEMPGLNGYQVCERLQADPSTSAIPIIFVTGKLDVKDEEKRLGMGAMDYITKPIHPPIVIARARTQVTLKQQKEKLEKMALHDQLTDLYNRHFLLDAATKKVSEAIRHQYPLSVLMLDIDFFKSINDEYGHSAGDTVLKSVAKLLKKEYRNEDIAARFGGEEFVVLLSHCTQEKAVIKANQLREKIEAMKPIGLKVTVSIGVSELSKDETSFTELLDRADQALYQAKESGRNKVIVYDMGTNKDN